jgi:hypothetical protein
VLLTGVLAPLVTSLSFVCLFVILAKLRLVLTKLRFVLVCPREEMFHVVSCNMTKMVVSPLPAPLVMSPPPGGHVDVTAARPFADISAFYLSSLSLRTFGFSLRSFGLSLLIVAKQRFLLSRAV